MKVILKNGKLDVVAANTSGVYGLQFPDGKWLVGYSKCILTRLPRYVSGEKINTKTKAVVVACGWNSVTGYLLEKCDAKKDVLMRKEEEWSTKLQSTSDGYNMVPCGYGCAESGKLAPRPIYGTVFKKKVSEAMKRYHMTKKGRSPKKYNNWKKLWANAKAKYPTLDLHKSLGGYPLDTEFGVEFDKLSNWNKQRVINVIKT